MSFDVLCAVRTSSERYWFVAPYSRWNSKLTALGISRLFSVNVEMRFIFVLFDLLSPNVAVEWITLPFRIR